MQLSCNYVHVFKQLSMYIFAFHLICVLKYVITNRAMKRLVFLVEHGPKVWNSVIRLCIF